MEDLRIFGVVQTTDEVRIGLAGVPNQPRSIAAIFGLLAAEDIGAYLVEQRLTSPFAERFDLAFTVARSRRHHALRALESARGRIGFIAIRCDEDIGRISLLGTDMRSHAVVTARLLAGLTAARIRFEFVSTSADEISLIIRLSDAARAMDAVRATFGPDVDQVNLVDTATLTRWTTPA